MKTKRILIQSAIFAFIVVLIYYLLCGFSEKLATIASLTLFSGGIAFIILYTKYILASLSLDNQAAVQLSHLTFNTIIPWSHFSLQPRTITKILNEIQLRNPKIIVECGSGVSTIFIAKVLSANGGHLYSIEHEPIWASYISQIVKTNSLSPHVTIIHANLVKYSCYGLSTLWYDNDVLNSYIPKNSLIDMLVVDGPPHKSGPMARLMTLQYFAPLLAPGSLVVLDDYNRSDEKKIVKRWKNYYDLTNHSTIDGRTSFYIFNKNDSHNCNINSFK
ncbi:MAG: class I SAM-dependent methyltransferase [Bacteroidales bacterium]|nr:class I SAM-dependent methyltransferase [Bacteroidales bacterium]